MSENGNIPDWVTELCEEARQEGYENGYDDGVKENDVLAEAYDNGYDDGRKSYESDHELEFQEEYQAGSNSGYSLAQSDVIDFSRVVLQEVLSTYVIVSSLQKGWTIEQRLHELFFKKKWYDKLSEYEVKLLFTITNLACFQNWNGKTPLWSETNE